MHEYCSAKHESQLKAVVIKKLYTAVFLMITWHLFSWNLHFAFNPIQDGHFWGCSKMGVGGGGKKSPLLKICHTYPAMMKLSTVIPYLKKIPKLYKSRDTPPEFCWHQHFFPEISKFCYINKCRYRLYWYIVSYSFNFLINLVKILMMSAKMATQIFLK